MQIYLQKKQQGLPHCLSFLVVPRDSIPLRMSIPWDLIPL